MKEFWRSKSTLLAVIWVCNFCLLGGLSFCCSLNEEGMALLSIKEKIVGDPYGALSNWVDEVGVESPCSWFGVGCSDGYVVDLKLKDLCLKGTLAPQVGNLVHLKSIILRNNSFSGVIPEEITKLQELEVLDIGYNNFSGQLPRQLGNNFSMTILLLDNNELLVSTCPEIYLLQKLSETQVEEDILSGTNQASSCDSLLVSRNSVSTRNAVGRALLQLRPTTRTRRRNSPPPLISPASPTPSPSPAPSPFASPTPTPSPSPSPSPFSTPSATPSSTPSPTPTPSSSPSRTLSPPSNNRTFPTAPPAPEERRAVNNNNSRNNLRLILLGTIGGPVLLALIVLGVFCYRTGKVASVKPWATGLSGQLQKAFVTGVPKLKRCELEAACEDFSNVIGSSSVCTFYKGTLSSGTEIAVVSTAAAASAKELPTGFEALFRKKIDVLSKVNHKNFASLLGYCEEDQPFTRMMVFEYAPNGTLFEHIHIREAEHLDWLMRLRIAIGMAYCLDHMHQLKPPLAHRNLTSSSIYLTEDYAAKISDFLFWDEPNSQTRPSDNVYSFGVILFEMMTGRLPYSAGGGSSSFEDWAADYLSRGESMRDIVDPTLVMYAEDQLARIGDVIRTCVEPNPRRRPTMREVCERLRGITGIGPDGSVPKLSPLWWAEIEIMSNDVS